MCLFVSFFSKFVSQVGDFGDANSWPTPGEIATKDMQVGVVVCLISAESQDGVCVRRGHTDKNEGGVCRPELCF